MDWQGCATNGSLQSYNAVSWLYKVDLIQQTRLADKPAVDSNVMSLSNQLGSLLDDGVRCNDADRRCHFNDRKNEQTQTSLLDTRFVVSQAKALQNVFLSAQAC